MTDPSRSEKYRRQAEMLANKVVKKFRHLRKRYARENIEVFRLYDWDIPEIRAVVDWYAGHLVIGEYTRKQSTTDWLPLMGQTVGEALEVPAEKVHLKQRYAGKRDGRRYERIDHTDRKIVVSERDMKFLVNPWDYVDTGLFSDHRDTRRMVRDMAAGKDFLNLYCYTGAFTCYAAKGGARRTLSVDRSETAIQWVRENLELNGVSPDPHLLVQDDAFAFLRRARGWTQRFDLVVVDPPSFSTTRSSQDEFDIVADHPALLAAVVDVTRPGATIFFSTNHQEFTPRMDHLAVSAITEITDLTIPEDYRTPKKKIHRCWKITV